MTSESKLQSFIALTRFDKPIGILLLLWPTLSALWLASGGAPSPRLVGIFTLGTVVMRAAGCVINDIADRNFDRHVKRTQGRPLTTQQITLTEAIILLVIVASIALVLALQLNAFAFQLAIIGALVTAIYPYTKRFWQAPQAILGIAFAWGIPMAFAAVQNQLPSTCWLLFFATMAWIIAYDTEYAMVDREDDRTLNLHSTAIWFGTWDLRMIAILHAVMLALWLILGWMSHMNFLFYAGLLIAGVLLHQQRRRIANRDRDACFSAFIANHWVGLVLYFSTAFGQLV